MIGGMKSPVVIKAMRGLASLVVVLSVVSCVQKSLSRDEVTLPLSDPIERYILELVPLQYAKQHPIDYADRVRKARSRPENISQRDDSLIVLGDGILIDQRYEISRNEGVLTMYDEHIRNGARFQRTPNGWEYVGMNHEKMSDKLPPVPTDNSRSAPHQPPENSPPAKPGSAPE